MHIVHLTLILALTLGKLALMIALAFGSAHGSYAHRHLALASALILTLGNEHLTWQLILALALGRAHGQAPGQNGSCDPTAR